jgi:hypothetical protein
VGVGGQTAINLNGDPKPGGKALQIGDLKAGDRVSLVHFRDEDRESALRISALRVVSGEGVIRAIDPRKREVSIAEGPEETAPVKNWQLADRADISLNGRKLINNRLLTSADLQVGDKVSFGRDLKIVSIAASRHFRASGSIGAIQYDGRSFSTGGSGQQRTYVLTPECKTSLGGKDASLDDLRRGDQFEAQYDDPEAGSPAVISLAATRPSDPTKWIVILLCSEFDDASIPALSVATSATATLQRALEQRYAVPAEQTIVIANPSRIRLEQGLGDAVGKASQAGQCLVVVAARVFSGPKGPLIAPKDFDKSRADVTGVPLATVLSLVDQNPTANKYVVLDLAPLANGNSAAVSMGTIVDSIRGTRSRPLLKTTPILAADDATSGDAPAAMRLVTALPAAFAGAADPNRDNQITFSELNDYLKSSESNAGRVRSILPETTPPRLSDDAKQAIRRLAAMSSRQRYDKPDVQALIANAEQLAPKQAEPRIVGAIVLLKHKDFEEAQRLIGIVTTEHPKQSLAWEISAWGKFEKYNYSGGLNDLVQLMQNVPSEKLSESDRRAVLLAGRLREFSAGVEHQGDRRPPAAIIAALDAAVNARGPEVKALFEQGRSHVRTIIAEFQKKIEAASEPSDQNRLKLERAQVRNYVTYSWEAAVQLAIANLDVD